MATLLQSEPLLRLRDRREERKARRDADRRRSAPTTATGEPPAHRPGLDERRAAIEQVLAMLSLPRADDPARAAPWLTRGAVAPTALPSLALLAEAVSDGSLPLEPEFVFGARAGQGVAVNSRRWAGLSPSDAEAAMREVLADETVLVIRRVRDLVPFGRDLADALARATQARTDINVYVSAAESHGFGAHDDDHDVLVVQCMGQRRWTLFAGGRPLPLRRDVDPTFDVPPGRDVTLQVDLFPGDVLYVPRGTWHVVDRAGRTSGQPSLHMSIGIYRLTGLDLLDWLLAQVVGVEVVRADLPLGSDPEDLAAHLGRVARCVDEAVADLRAQPCAQVLADLNGSLPLLGPRHSARHAATTGKAVLTRCAHPVELFSDEGGAVFFAGGRRWRVLHEQRSLYERLLNSTDAAPVLVESLDDDGLAVLAQLQAAGLVYVAS